jgi:GntR family transcriptional repressor for pyruvate dehydrogenase complex
MPANAAELHAQRRLEIEFHNILARSCPHLLLAFMCQFPNDLLRDSVVYQLESHAAVHAMGEANADFHNRWLEAFRAEDKAAIHHLMHEHMCDGAERVTVSEVRVGTEELLLPAGSNL